MTAPEQMRADAWVKPYCDWRRDVGPIIANDGSAEAGFEAGWQAALSTRPATDELVEALEQAITHLTLVIGSKLCGESDWGKPDETARPYTTFGALKAARAFVAKHSALRNTGAVS